MGLFDFLKGRKVPPTNPLELVPDEEDVPVLERLVKKQRVTFIYNPPKANLTDVIGFFHSITSRGEIVVSREQGRHCDEFGGRCSYDLRYVHSVINLSNNPFIGRYCPLRINKERKE